MRIAQLARCFPHLRVVLLPLICAQSLMQMYIQIKSRHSSCQTIGLKASWQTACVPCCHYLVSTKYHSCQHERDNRFDSALSLQFCKEENNS